MRSRLPLVVASLLVEFSSHFLELMVIDCVIQDRQMVVQAVLDGVLSANYITEEELFDLEDRVFEAVCDKYTPFAIWETEQ